MVKTVPKQEVSDGFITLSRIGEENGEVCFERGFQGGLTSVEVAAALENEYRILKTLNGNVAPRLEGNQNDDTLRFSCSADHPLVDLEPLSLPLPLRLQMATRMAHVLCQLHRHEFLHLSLRPAAFLFDRNYQQALLIDFSCSQSYPKDLTGITWFRPVIADPYFLAPEQTGLQQRPLDQRTDLYALGCVLVWLFCGEKPFFHLTDQSAIEYAHIAQRIKVCIQGVGVSENRALVDALATVITCLLEKDPGARYQSAAGVLADLEGLVREEGPSDSKFEIRSRGRSDRLHLPQYIYGREAEVAHLMDAFERVMEGPSEALLIAGYSGVGKSALVNEIRYPVLKDDGLFVSGKFDQYRGGSPYSAIEQAFGQFIRNILTQSESEIEAWRIRFREALHPNAQLLVDIIPDLGVLMGPQPKPSELGSEEQQHRFNRVFLQFLKAISSAHKPLVVFIDDLQWADLASINLLRQVLADSSARYFLLLGAFRDNEVDERHPFALMLADLKREETPVSQLTLAPLCQDVLCRLISDALQQNADTVGALAGVVHEKTGGNPFFMRQFMHELYLNSLLQYDYETNDWRWSVNQISQQSGTDNVVALMVAKIGRLPECTQVALKQASCIGARFPVALMAALHGSQFGELLEPALQVGLLVPIWDNQSAQSKPPDVLRFLHDRVQQAAYSLLDRKERDQLHYRVGCLLLEDAGDEFSKIQDQQCFELVSHLNCAHSLLTAKQQRSVMELNLLAAKKAKTATAYTTAVEYLDCFFSLASFEADTMITEASIERLECLYLAGDYERAESIRPQVLSAAIDTHHEVQLQSVLITQYTRYGELNKAIGEALKALNRLGYVLPENPDMQDVGAAIQEVQALLAVNPFSTLADRPAVSDPKVVEQIEILMAMQPCCYNSGSLLFPLTILALLKLTITQGNTPHSSYVFMMYGLMCTKVLKDYSTAFEAARYSDEVASHFPASPLLEGRLQMMRSNFILPWEQPLKRSSEVREAAYNQCLEQGDYYWGVHAYIFGFYADLLVTPKLDLLLDRMTQVAKTCEKIKQPAQVYLSTLQCNLLHILSGELDNQHTLDHVPGYEMQAQAHYVANNYMCGRYDRLLGRLLQGYLFGNYSEALSVSLSADLTPADLDEGIFHEAVYNQLNLLAILALRQQNGELDNPAWQQWFDQNWPVLERWYVLNPDNFAPGYHLVNAEIAALEQNEASAYCEFEQAIIAARNCGFPLWQAIANERMGKYRLDQRQTTLGLAYLEEAVKLYQSWGAGAKAAEIQRYIRQVTPGIVISAGQQQDWRQLNDAIEEISSMQELPALSERMLAWSMQLTGAQYAALFARQDGAWQLTCDRISDGLTIQVSRGGTPVPEAMLNYCRNSGEVLLLEDARAESDFIADPYVLATGCRSVLVLPLYHYNRLLGVLYLEHRDTRNLFTAQRLRLLELLSNQFASSYNNSQLYTQLQAHNEMLEQVVEQRTSELQQKSGHLESILQALPIPYMIARRDGTMIECNNRFRAQFDLGNRLPEQVNVGEFYVSEHDRRYFMQELDQSGQVHGFECELRGLNGVKCWGLFSATYIDMNRECHIFAAISDISERKALEYQLHQQANTDPLTGVYNRRGMFTLGKQLHKSLGNDDLFLVMVDLDRFKQLNDTYGHAAGDEVLKAFTRAVARELRETDLFGRIGGEEFGLVLPHMAFNQAVAVLERIRHITEMLVVTYESEQIQVTMSAGMTRWRPDESMTEALERADARMYIAKQAGRNKIEAD